MSKKEKLRGTLFENIACAFRNGEGFQRCGPGCGKKIRSNRTIYRILEVLDSRNDLW